MIEKNPSVKVGEIGQWGKIRDGADLLKSSIARAPLRDRDVLLIIK